jgi:hypothetical protein
MLAWFVATLDGATPSPFDVDWGRLFGTKQAKPWITQLHDPIAIAIRDAATTTGSDPVLMTATMFRDSYQHRHPLRGGVADFRDALRLPAVLASVVDVRATLGPGRRLDAGTPHRAGRVSAPVTGEIPPRSDCRIGSQHRERVGGG